jgi:hypothetical protein
MRERIAQIISTLRRVSTHMSVCVSDCYHLVVTAAGFVLLSMHAFSAAARVRAYVWYSFA